MPSSIGSYPSDAKASTRRLWLAAAVACGQWALASDQHPGRPDASLLARLTPASPPGAYAVYTDDRPIEAVAAQYRERHPAPHPRSWAIGSAQANDIFAETVRAGRGKLLRLYGATRPRLARGPIVVEGRTVESVTLVSPYPDAAFERLLPGTLIVVTRIGAQDTSPSAAPPGGRGL
jgi:hypothetical protein